MDRKSLKILGVLITDQAKDIENLQYTLTKFGNIIRTRIGLNDLNEFDSDRRSMILLELYGDRSEMIKLEDALDRMVGLQIKKMDF